MQVVLAYLCAIIAISCVNSFQLTQNSFRRLKIGQTRQKHQVHLVVETNNEDIFGAEFRLDKSTLSRSKDKVVDRADVMRGYQKLRSTVLFDSIFFALLGVSVVWALGTVKDVCSYSLGAVLGISYSVLLGRYVERIGTVKENKASDGLRFIPVVLLVILYTKNKPDVSLIMELAGFAITYQAATFLQGFNQDAYGESNNTGESFVE